MSLVKMIVVFLSQGREGENSGFSALAPKRFVPSLCLVGTCTVLRTRMMMRTEVVLLSERNGVESKQPFCPACPDSPPYPSIAVSGG